MAASLNDSEPRCLLCDRILADTTQQALPGEKSCQCGKRMLVEEFVPLVQPVNVPTVAPVKPPPIPEVLPEARIVRPGIPPVVRPSIQNLRTAELPDSEPPKPKLAFALFIAFLTLLAIMASLTVIGYAIVTGLKKAAKRVEAVPTIRVTTSPTPGR